MMKLKSCLKTTNAHKLMEDFTEEAPDVTLANVMNTVVMLISFLFREEAILKLRTNLWMHLRRFLGLGQKEKETAMFTILFCVDSRKLEFKGLCRLDFDKFILLSRYEHSLLYYASFNY